MPPDGTTGTIWWPNTATNATGDYVVFLQPAYTGFEEVERFVEQTKAELARESMRRYLARFPRLDTRVPRPRVRPRAKTDPLRCHRQRMTQRERSQS